MNFFQPQSDTGFLTLLTLTISVICLLLFLERQPAAAKEIWCCRGWADDFAASPSQVDTEQVQSHCRGSFLCKKRNSSDCATVWSASGNDNELEETAADCSKPESTDQKTCICKTDFCNCPTALKGIKTPEIGHELKCCYGWHWSDGKPDWAKPTGCGTNFDHCGAKSTQYSSSVNATKWECINPRFGRLREECIEFFHEPYDEKYDQGCRCISDYCNCPPEFKKKFTTLITTTPAAASNIRAYWSIQIGFLFNIYFSVDLQNCVVLVS